MDALIVVVAQGALFLVIAAALVLWAISTPCGRLELAVGGIVAVVLVALAVKGTSALWTDPRPFVVDGMPPLFDHPADNGFPSDHTALAAAVSGVVLAARRRWGMALLVATVLIGAARVAAHVHHVPDIGGGLVIGLVCAAAAFWVAREVGRWVASSREISPLGLPGRRVEPGTRPV